MSVKSPAYRPFAASALRTISVTGNPFVYTNTSGRLQSLVVSGGLLVAISLGGLSLGLVSASFLVRPGDVVTIAYTTAPQVNVLDIM